MSPTKPLPRRLSPLQKVALALEVLSAYRRARWSLRRTDLPRTLGRLRGDPPPPEPTALEGAERREALRLGSVARRVLEVGARDSRCLMQSLVLTSLLARRGLGSGLVIGVRNDTTFGAHAWVEVAGQPLLPPGGSAFERLVKL
jgi:Transglutaminase-like superfamily